MLGIKKKINADAMNKLGIQGDIFKLNHLCAKLSKDESLQNLFLAEISLCL